MSYLLTYAWADFISRNLDQLQRGCRVWTPPHLTHPRVAGFAALTLAEPDGQVEDWVSPLGEGRVHVHICADGQMLVHLDRWDPDRGLASMLKHFFLETKTGKIVAAGAAIAAISWVTRRRSA